MFVHIDCECIVGLAFEFLTPLHRLCVCVCGSGGAAMEGRGFQKWLKIAYFLCPLDHNN